MRGRRFSPPIVRDMLEAQQRERQQITRELAKVKGLMPLLMKRRNGGRWTIDERHQLIEQLHAFAHLSPYLVVLVMPGSFLFLPALAWWLDRRRGKRATDPDKRI
ncbi:hypothetical protein MASR1M60_00440 [Rhodocyclaceae bacterium]